MNNIPKIEDRNLFIVGDITQESLHEVVKSIITINESDRSIESLSSLHGYNYTPKPIKIYIESYGGDVVPTMGLVGVIQQSKTPVHTISVGGAMSCGFILLISGHKRFCYEHSTPLYHQISGFKRGTLKNQEEGMTQSKKFQKWVETHTLSNTRMTKNKLKRIYKGKKDLYMTSQEALDLGVVDEIIK